MNFSVYELPNQFQVGLFEEYSKLFNKCIFSLQVAQERICDDELIMVRSPKQRTAASIILRGPNGKLYFSIPIHIVYISKSYIIFLFPHCVLYFKI